MDASTSTSRSFSATATESGVSGGQSWKENRPYYVCKYCHQIFEYFNHFLRHVKNHPAFQDGTKSLSMAIIQSTVHPFQEQHVDEEDLTDMDREEEEGTTNASTSSPIMFGFLGAQFLGVTADRDDNTITGDDKVKSTEQTASSKLVCDKCKHCFSNKTSLKYHLKNRMCSKGFRETRKRNQRDPGQNRLKKTVSIRPLQCKHCKLKFTTLDYKYHIKNRACIGYKTKYQRASSKIPAPKSVPLSTSSVSSGKMHKCEVCQKGFNKRCYLTKHMKRHTGGELHTCHYCPKNFSDSWNRNRHEKSKHNVHEEQRRTSLRTSAKLSKLKPKSPGKVYSCEFCKGVFKNERHLKNHERTHSSVHTGGTGEQPYICGYCPKRFPSYSSRFQHEKQNHTKIKPFRCEHCKKTFATNYLRKLHSKVHNENDVTLKPYSCEYCEKAFPYPISLKYHRMRYHTGERPHSCTLCGKSFVQAGNLKYHLKASHAGEN